MRLTGTGKRKWVLLAAVGLAVALCGVGTLSAGVYLDSPHGDTTDGVYRDSAYTRGHCAQCHDPHSGTTGGYNLVTAITDNGICFTATTSCHQGLPTSYSCYETDRVASSDSDNRYYFEKSSSGLNNRCRWPGENVWESTSSQTLLGATRYVSPHHMDSGMPKNSGANQGLCSNCHTPHGVASPQLDMLINDYNKPGSIASDSFGLCFNVTLGGTSYACHSTTGTATTSTTGNDLIKSFYDSADDGAGHQVRCSTKTLTSSSVTACNAASRSGEKQPCYNCHDPHGSRGANGSNENYFLLSDQPDRGWSGMEMTVASQIRTFCFGCHVASNGSGTKMVMGLVLKTIPSLTAHETGSTSTSCYDCHKRDYTSGGQNVHNPGTGGTCVDCHTGTASGSTYTRRAIVPEFGLAWGHLASGSDSVDNDDCVVCHMEGNSTSDPTPSTVHMDESVDLRDPDTGTQIQYGGSTYKFGQFSRNTASSALETPVVATMEMQCLKCHDSNGANNSAARVSGGSASDPWNQGASVINVYSQFDTGNATFHPVRGPQNNDYCDSDTMLSPWNQFSKTVGTLTDGNLITCFDCHNAESELSTGSITAHGGSVTLRAAYNASSGTATPICAECHDATNVYWSTQTHKVDNGVSALQRDEPLDEWGTGKGCSSYHYISNWSYYGCTICHGMTQDDGTMPAQGSRGPDVHGSNTVGVSGSTTWTSGARPYSFLRNGNNFNDWDNDSGATTYGYCDMSGISGGSGGCRGTDGYYSPGGSY